MSDKPHDPTRWSHSTTELAEAKTPPPPNLNASSHPNRNSDMGSVRSSQYSGTKEDGDKTAVGTNRDERKILTSSGNTARNTRFAHHQAALSAIGNPLDTDTEPVQVNSANTGEDLKAVISSGNKAKKTREGFKSSDRVADGSTDIKPFDELQEGTSKRDTFGK